MKINDLKIPIAVILEQYICLGCKKLFYINSEDKLNELVCPFCNSETKNIRQFKIKIEGIGEY